jgi:hypothetical protein
LRQGSAVTPDSGKTVLRSGLVRKLPETAGQGASAEKPPPAEIVCSQDTPALGIGYRRREKLLSRSTLAEVTFVYRGLKSFNAPSMPKRRIQRPKEQSLLQ